MAPQSRRRKPALVLLVALFMAMLSPPEPKAPVPRHVAVLKSYKDAEEGDINITGALTIAGVIVGAVVGLAVLAALAPSWFDATADLSENFSTADVGDETANGIANNVFPLIIGLLGVFAIAGIAFAVMKIRKG